MPLSPHIGHRTRPAVIDSPGALERACARVWDPTPEQAEAGNYGLAHVMIGGLPIAIETPLDRVRRSKPGTQPPWSVRMPAHYGYFKKTEGADGDAVDVYVGPDSHIAHRLPVWILDQCDAESGAYDEHKTFLGFKDKKSAHQAYLGAFSDGKGQKRIGKVVQTTFEGLKNWLSSGDTKQPVAMHKSASVHDVVASYGPPTCKCDACNGVSGGSMADPVAKANSETSVSSAGVIGRVMTLIQKGMAGLSPTEQAEVVAEASLLAKSELGKASSALDAHENELKHVDQIEDLWDGPPDDRAETVRAHGPRSEVRPGKINVGPGQEASGNGAEKMEREYSEHTRQTGVQYSTERLGEAVMGIGKSMKSTHAFMKSMFQAMEAQNMQIELLKSTTATVVPVDSKMIEKAIAEGIAKAMVPITKSIRTLRKADKEAGEDDKDDDKETESGKDDEEDEDDEDEDAENEESGSGVEIEIDNDVEDEDDDEDEASKAIVAKARQLRQMAKNRVKWANRRFAKAEEHDEEGRKKRAERFKKMAKANIRKAVSYMDAANALRLGHEGSGTARVMKAIAKAKAKGRIASNQDIWPDKGEMGGYSKGGEGTGKAVADVAAQSPTTKAMQEAAHRMEQAAKGLGLLVTDMSGLFKAVAGQSRDGGGNKLPPALHLAAVGKGGDVNASLEAMADGGVITYDDVERTRDFLRLSATGVPEEFKRQKMALLPEAVRNLLAA